MEGDDDRRNPLPLPSNYVTLVQLQERWLQEKQRKQREKEEQEERDRKINKEKQQAESITAFPRANHRPPLRKERWIPSEKCSTQFRAVGVSDGISRNDDLVKKGKNGEKWKQMRGKVRVEEDLIGGTERSRGKKGNRKHPRGVKNRGKPGVEEDLTNGEEQLVKNEVEAENVEVVSTERECERERITIEFEGKCVAVSSGGGRRRNGRYSRGVRKLGNKRLEKDLDIDEAEAGDIDVVSTGRDGESKGNGKSLVVEDRVWEEKVKGGDGSVGVLRKLEGLSVRDGKGRNGRFAGDMSGGSTRRYIGGCGRVVNGCRVARPGASNFVWVKKKEGETSDANVAGV